jgi:cytochrome P450
VAGKDVAAGKDAGEAVGELLAGQGRTDPYPVYEAIRAHGPLARVQDRFYVASGYAAVDELLRDPRMLIADRELASFYGTQDGPATAEEMVVGRSMLRSNPPDHTRMRRLAAGAFTPRRLESMRETIVTQATTLTKYLAHLGGAGEPIDFITEFAYPLPIRVICALLGVPAGDQHWFREQAAALTAVLEPALLLSDIGDALQARSRLDLYFTDLVAQRRADPRDDLVTALTQAHDSDGATLSGPELIANLVLLLVAGFETTTNLLGNGLALLLSRPDLAAALRKDPALAPSFVEEVLRYDSPVQLTSRWCRDEVVGDGVRLEPYSQVLLLLGAANRDPHRYGAPDVFDPSRDPNHPMSFGAGAHYCLGAALARMEAQIAFPMLVRELPTLALGGTPLRRQRLTLRGYAELPVTL